MDDSERGSDYCYRSGQRLRSIWIVLCSILLLSSVTVSIFAQDESEISSAFSEEGSQGCLDCHDEQSDSPVLSIYHTPHGIAADKRTPAGGSGCESCHGPSAAHAKKPKKAPPAISFGPDHPSDPEKRASSCVACHQDNTLSHWDSSTHEQEELACDDCHQSHLKQDTILDKKQQADLCFDCHKTEQAKIDLPSRHPIKEGKTTCSDCHNPHGSSTTSDLLEPTVSEACLSCHNEKRGPFLFEHAPVTETCIECHEPHGSAHPALLVSRPPFLCQQCHMSAFHPSQLNDGGGLSVATPNSNLLGKSCLNCHSSIHGSNHPSGARLTR